MLERGSGRVVTVASTAGRAGARYTAAYTASKHAAVGLMRAVAAEVAGHRRDGERRLPEAFVRTDMTQRSVERIAAVTRAAARPRRRSGAGQGVQPLDGALRHVRAHEGPGQTAFAVTPVPATSAATARMSPTAACFDAVYAAV